MPLPIWLRRAAPLSNTRQAWEERLGLAALVAAVGGAWWFAGAMTLAEHTFLWGGLLVALAVLMRRGWLKLLGPLFYYDTLRTTRRTRFILYRVYAVLVMIFLAWFFFAWALGTDTGVNELTAAQMADLAAQFVYALLGAQLVGLTLVTPAYTASALAGEKDRKTLEFLLATDLRGREVVLGKLVSRLATVYLTLLTGIPIFCFMEVMGGVYPDIVVAGLVLTAASTASLGALGVLNSVYARRSREALLVTYLQVATYCALALLSRFIPGAVLNWSVPFLPWLGSAGEWLSWFQSGDPIWLVWQVGKCLNGGAHLADFLPALLRDYLCFHGLFFAVCVTWASLQVRPVFLKQTYGVALRTVAGVRWKPRWFLTRWPMVWKEVLADAARRSWAVRILILLLVAASFVPAVLITAYYTRAGWSRPGSYEWEMASWARGMGAAVGCFLLLGVAIRAAGSFSNERDRQTLDSLLSTPLSATELLAGKWLGAVLGVRWGWLWLGSIWLTGVAVDGLHAGCLPVLVLAWLIYAALLANIGLWFSLVSQTTLRAGIYTLLTGAGVSFGHLLLPMSVATLSFSTNPNEPLYEWALRFQMGLTPPAVLGALLPWNTAVVTTLVGTRTDGWERPMAALGLVLWALAAWLLGRVTLRRLQKSSGRLPRNRPEIAYPEKCPDQAAALPGAGYNTEGVQRSVLEVTGDR